MQHAHLGKRGRRSDLQRVSIGVLPKDQLDLDIKRPVVFADVGLTVRSLVPSYWPSPQSAPR